LRLAALPESFNETREALHQIAFFAISPARYRAMGRMGLAPAPGGFGAPEFDGKIARVEGDILVFESGANVASQLITNVRNACRFFGHEYEIEWYEDFRDPLQPVDPDVALMVDDQASRALGRWYEFGFDILEEMRSRGVASDAASEVQLWPEHFDAATELGDSGRGERASFGASPGDAAHAAPYIYVAAWGEIDRSNPYWNDTSFNGSSRGYAELVSVDDPRGFALDFLTEGYRILHGA
jgi:hypothetical protein